MLDFFRSVPLYRWLEIIYCVLILCSAVLLFRASDLRRRASRNYQESLISLSEAKQLHEEAEKLLLFAKAKTEEVQEEKENDD